MKTILCYGDSNTWGANPVDGSRFDINTRWPGVLQNRLGNGFKVVEEGMPGRATVWTDPVEGLMSGIDYLVPCLYSHKPIDLAVLMLGTNDLKYRFSLTAFDIAEAIKLLIRVIQKSESGPDGQAPQILVIAPPPLGQLNEFAEMLTGGLEKSLQLGLHYERVAGLTGSSFLDSSTIIKSSDVDGVHFEPAEHNKLGIAVAEQVKRMLFV